MQLEELRPGVYEGRRRCPSSEFPSVCGELLIPVPYELGPDADEEEPRAQVPR
jgi:hypothetical protein